MALNAQSDILLKGTGCESCNSYLSDFNCNIHIYMFAIAFNHSGIQFFLFCSNLDSDSYVNLYKGSALVPPPYLYSSLEWTDKHEHQLYNSFI